MSKTLYEQIAVTKSGDILVQDEDGRVFRVVEVKAVNPTHVERFVGKPKDLRWISPVVAPRSYVADPAVLQPCKYGHPASARRGTQKSGPWCSICDKIQREVREANKTTV